jgi:hypothetical protein
VGQCITLWRPKLRGQGGAVYYIVEAKVKWPGWDSVLHCGGQN